MEERPTRTPLPPALAAGAMLVAGLLHLLLVDDHMAHARGTGLFFLGLGAVQVVWAFLYLRTPTDKLARAGLVALALAPTVLYVLTRVWRAPWSDAPEPVDLLGVATQLFHLVAAAPIIASWAPAIPDRAPAALGVGILLAVGGYAGAIAVEGVDWLASADGGHLHDLDDHDDHADGDHGAHDGHGTAVDAFGARGVNVVGTVSYYGPTTGVGIDQACQEVGHPDADCWLHHLYDLLNAEGAVAAFDALVELLEANPKADFRGHELAHKLGHHAYRAYGLNITLTLGECSYEVFQGCIHGSLQTYFDDLARRGLAIDQQTLRGVCAAATTSFESYTCLHGVGHGVVMYTNYDLAESLDACHLLDGSFEQKSCYGGAFMENVVAYLHSKDPNAPQHDHGHAEPPEFWVDEDDPAYPCNAIKDRYRESCWRMQTSLILHFNRGNFEDASRTCDAAGDYRLDCYTSLGRDAPPYANRDPVRMSKMCSNGAQDAQVACVEAFTAGIILDANTPEAGVELCAQVPEDDKEPCYRKTGDQAQSMLGEAEAAALCDRVPEPYTAACHEGRQ